MMFSEQTRLTVRQSICRLYALSAHIDIVMNLTTARQHFGKNVTDAMNRRGIVHCWATIR
jgi:uncharacterized lipoprotein YajG